MSTMCILSGIYIRCNEKFTARVPLCAMPNLFALLQSRQILYFSNKYCPMKSAITIICLISAAILAFLFWLIYFHESPNITRGEYLAYIPALNSIFNTLSATCVISGLIFIKRGKVKAHITMMVSATIASACFLVGYIIHHYYQGDTKFLAEGTIRTVYFFILITHIVLSVAVVPMVLTTLYCAISKRFAIHKKIARFTWPIWLYVSITGVLIFAILELFNTPLIAA